MSTRTLKGPLDMRINHSTAFPLRSYSLSNPFGSLQRLVNVSEEYDAEYFRSLARNLNISRTHGIDGALKTYKLDALVLPANAQTTTPPAKGTSNARPILSRELTRPHSWLPHCYRPSRLLSRRHCSRLHWAGCRPSRSRRAVRIVVHWHRMERVRAYWLCVCIRTEDADSTLEEGIRGGNPEDAAHRYHWQVGADMYK
jgi:hypothetical protein